MLEVHFQTLVWSENQWQIPFIVGIGSRCLPYQRGVCFALSVIQTHVTLLSYMKETIFVPKKTYTIYTFLSFMFMSHINQGILFYESQVAGYVKIKIITFFSQSHRQRPKIQDSRGG